MRFSEISGQRPVIQRLVKNAATGRIPHAQLLLGPEGSGNLAVALAFAQYLHCTGKTGDDSCGECPSCRKHQTLTHPDLHFSFPFPSSKADVASELLEDWRKAIIGNPYLNFEMWMQALASDNKQGNIPVKECRAILKSLSLKPFEGEYKILIMWMPEYLGNEGNVLLKAIEEPTQNTILILVAEQTEKILTTILSRTQLIRIPPIQPEELAKTLAVEYELAAEEAARIALLSGGNYLRACELAEQAENEYLGPFRDWLRLCYKRDFTGAVKWAESYATGGREQLKGFFLYALEIFRAASVRNYVPDLTGLSKEEEEFTASLAGLIRTGNKTEALYKMFNDASYEIQRNGNAKLVLTDLSFKLARIIK